MRRAAAVALALASCGPRPVPETLDRPVAEAAAPAPLPVANANFELVVAEVVPNAEDEGVSYTAAFVDGALAGRTEVGPRSSERRLRLRVEPGNRPVRLEHWLLPPVGDWERLPAARQPRERFVRFDDASLARLTLRYGADGRPALAVAREPFAR